MISPQKMLAQIILLLQCIIQGPCFLLPPISTRWQVEFKVDPMALCPKGKTYFNCFRITGTIMNCLETSSLSIECLSRSRHLTVAEKPFLMEHMDHLI